MFPHKAGFVDLPAFVASWHSANEAGATDLLRARVHSAVSDEWSRISRLLYDDLHREIRELRNDIATINKSVAGLNRKPESPA